MGRILLVCTGAVCRSPAAASLLRAALAGQAVTVRAVGTRALAGAPMDPRTLAALPPGSPGAREHVAHQLVAADVAGADLVLGLTTEHRAAAVLLVPAAVRRSFTLLELARLVGATHPAAPRLEDPDAMPGRLADLCARAVAARPLAAGGPDDVPDPVAEPAAAHVETVARIAEAVRSIAAALAVPPHGAEHLSRATRPDRRGIRDAQPLTRAGLHP
ncbi:low molecular weight phosphatase family protein [Cellulomonas sp. C5510]|nr:low molecular weight phosphatase family protein [Cellulomonas sp. C5510]